MTFERTFDAALIRKVFTDPAIYPHITDDSCPSPDQWQPTMHEAVWYVLVKDGDELLGVWMLVPHNAICYEIHTCLLPASWGARAEQAAKELAAWVWDNMPARRVITNVPRCNRLALRFAKRAGMTEFGVNKRSFLKHGQLHDQIMLGISKGE